MSSSPKRFRIEREAARARTAPPAPDLSEHQDTARREPVGTPARRYSEIARTRSAPPRPELERLAHELHAMRDAIWTTKREIGELQRSPAGQEGIHRAACELDAVSAATERATTAILTAVEEIELAASQMRSSGSDASDGIALILDRVILLYEACNFQDISGQRIRKVVRTLKFVEEKLDTVIAVWGPASVSATLVLAADPRGPATPPLNGPALPGEKGHVSQDEVDAFFR